MRAPLPTALLALIIAPLGCWSAATKTFDTGAERDPGVTAALDTGAGSAGGGADSGVGGGTDSGTDGGGTTGASDIDGDGYSAAQGDCDDEDERVHPGALDDCDGWDEDCDGEIDEDARYDDEYEPNDEPGEATDLGSLEDEPDQLLAAYLYNIDDVDRYQVYMEDSWLDFFSVSVSLSDIPDDATYRVSVFFLDPDGDVELGSAYGSGQVEVVIDDGLAQDETGTYEIVVEAESAPDCGRAYQLEIVNTELY